MKSLNDIFQIMLDYNDGGCDSGLACKIIVISDGGGPDVTGDTIASLVDKGITVDTIIYRQVLALHQNFLLSTAYCVTFWVLTHDIHTLTSPYTPRSFLPNFCFTIVELKQEDHLAIINLYIHLTNCHSRNRCIFNNQQHMLCTCI